MASAKKNFIYQASYEIIVLLFPLLTSPYVSRVLGADNIGMYSYTFAIANYFVLFSALGIKNYGNREIARCRNNKELLNQVFTSIALLHFIVSIIVLLGYLTYIFLFVQANVRLYAIISGLYVVAAIFDISWLFFGLEQFKITVFRNFVIKIFSLIAVFAFVRTQNDLWKYIAISAGAQLLSQLYLWFHIKKYVRFCKVTKKEVLNHLPQMLVLFIPTIAISLYNFMDKIMVGIVSGNMQLGFYENSEKIISIASAVIGSLGTVMMPRMSNVLSAGNVERGKRYISLSIEFILWLSIAMAFGIIGVSKVFAPLFWGEEFKECSILLAFLAAVLPFKAYANVIRTQYLIPMKKDKQYTVSVCMGACVNLVANLILIPKLQSLGAVIGTILAEVTVCFYQASICKTELPVYQYFIRGIPYVCIGSIMCIAVKLLGMLKFNEFIVLGIQVLIGVVVYGCISMIYIKKYKPDLFLSVSNLKRIKSK